MLFSQWQQLHCSFKVTSSLTLNLLTNVLSFVVLRMIPAIDVSICSWWPKTSYSWYITLPLTSIRNALHRPRQLNVQTISRWMINKMIFIPSFYTVSNEICLFFFIYLMSRVYSWLYSGMAERDGPRRPTFCPFDFFDGEIKFDYFVNGEKVCGGYESILSQCPSSSSLNIRYMGCKHSLQSVNYECIGHWNALNKHYFAVIEWINGTLPKYKCGVSSPVLQCYKDIKLFFSRLMIIKTAKKLKWP